VQRTRATALAAARSELLGSLASDLAKGVDPFEPGGMAGPAGRDRTADPESRKSAFERLAPRFRAVSRPSRRGAIRVER